MADMLRKLLGKSSKKAAATTPKKQNPSYYEEEEVEEDEDDYAELHFTPTTSRGRGSRTPPPLSLQFTQSGLPLGLHQQTPKLYHDETLDSEQSFEQPSQKRHKSSSPLFDVSVGEDQIYEHTQYQLAKWERQETRHQERRKRKRAARRVEQENYVNAAFGQAVQLQDDEEAVAKIRRERDHYRREAQKYKQKYEELERKYKQLERRQHQQQNYGFQPFHGYNMFNVTAPSPFFQPPPQVAPPTFLLQPTPSLIQQQPPAPFMAPLSSSSTPFPGIGPSGPMAPRYPDPYNFDDQDDDDTSQSDLSNSSKSDTSLNETK